MDTARNQTSAQSEIALFLELWAREVEAIEQGLHGYAVTARHDIILQKMQAFGEKNLKELKRLDEKRMGEMKEEQEENNYHENSANERDDEKGGVP